MKFNLTWHRNSYANRLMTLCHRKEDLESRQKRYNEASQALSFYKAQIDLAEKEGKDGFDSEKYAIKRLCV